MNNLIDLVKIAVIAALWAAILFIFMPYGCSKEIALQDAQNAQYAYEYSTDRVVDEMRFGAYAK